jgi:hypothetical protein
MAEITGGVLVAVTVTRKLVLVVCPPSLTEIVMIEKAFWFTPELTVTVRLEPEPPNEIAESGMRPLLDELPLTDKLAAAVSTSPIVKASGPTEAPATTD